MLSLVYIGGRSAVIGMGNRLQANWSESRFPVEARFFLFSKMSGLSLGPTQPHTQGFPRFFFSGVKRSGHKVTHIHLMPKLRMRGAIPLLSYSLCLYGVYRAKFTFF
jgi:hypothetical protein